MHPPPRRKPRTSSSRTQPAAPGLRVGRGTGTVAPPMTTRARTMGRFVLWAHVAIGVGCGTAGGPAGPPEEVVKVPGQGTVVVYVEAPKRTAAPLFSTFQDQTGIRVDATYRETLGDRFLTALKEDAAKGKVDLFWGES